MMKTRTMIGHKKWRVECEPGDATHYSYNVTMVCDKDEPSEHDPHFHFEAVNNGFPYPVIITETEAFRMLEMSDQSNRVYSQEVLDRGKMYLANPMTVIECCRTVLDITNDD